MSFPNIPAELRPKDPRFGAGPSLIPPEHVEALAKTGRQLLGTSHRKPAVKNLVKDIQQNIREYFDLPEDYQVVLGNGGATLLWDMIALGMVENKSRHFTNGEFSSKWYKAHKKVPWIEAEEVSVDFGKGQPITAGESEDFLCATLNETSTGVQTTELPVVDREKCLIGVDATSGAGQIPMDIAQTDVFYFSPQKVFAGEGGLFVSILSPQAVERTKKIAALEQRYIPVIMQWDLAIDNSAKNQTYNTPGVAGLFLLNQQLKKMVGLGFKEVAAQAKKKADLVYGWADEKEYLSPFVAKEYRSTTVATVDVDEKIPVGPIIDELRNQGLVYDIDAYRKLGRNQFRIGMFHNVSFEDLEKLTKLLSFLIEK